MKRSPPPKRKKPLARTGWDKSSKPKQRGAYIRKVSGRKRKADAMARPAKMTWLDRWNFCWWCGAQSCWLVRLGIHHMSKRSHGGAWEQPCNWLLCCDVCNCGPLESSDKATQAKALMLKRRHDPEHFDLAEWNRIHTGGKGERITLAAVDAAEREMV